MLNIQLVKEQQSSTDKDSRMAKGSGNYFITGCIFIILQLLPLTLGHDDPIMTRQEVRVDHLRKEPLTLDCAPEEVSWRRFQHWVTPYDMIIDENFLGNRHLELLPNNYSLTIAVVDYMDLGDYLCLVEDDGGQIKYYRTTVYLYTMPAWEMYRHNFIVAISCSAAFLVVVGTILVVYTCRWQTQAGEDEVSLEQGTNGYVNTTFDMDVNNREHPVKPSADTKL